MQSFPIRRSRRLDLSLLLNNMHAQLSKMASPTSQSGTSVKKDGMINDFVVWGNMQVNGTL